MQRPGEEEAISQSDEAMASVERFWRSAEVCREKSWQRDPSGIIPTLRHRAVLAVRSLPILPGQTVLEIAAGSGIWTEHLSAVLGGNNSITGAVFNGDLVAQANSRCIASARFLLVKDLRDEFTRNSFDYIVGTDIWANDLRAAILDFVYRCLKPGGRLLFFSRNATHPVAVCRNALKRAAPGFDIFRGVRFLDWTSAAREQGFTEIQVSNSEVIFPSSSAGQNAIGLILERCPIVRCFSKVTSIQASKAGVPVQDGCTGGAFVTRRELFRAVSVVVPCHNEEANIDRLVNTMIELYGDYIHEIVIVDDSSTDRTSEVAAAASRKESRVRLLRREPPGGVGRALREGYAAASGRYILSIDCDFISIAGEFKGLFDAVADGYDGAIGSRFSSESALVRYPFLKILCNRGYHLILNLLLGRRVRDISNNLKLYRAEILKNLEIESDGFAANVETGLKPILMNYRIREVPASWINRTSDMGNSSFNLLKTGPAYTGMLIRIVVRNWRGQYRSRS